MYIRYDCKYENCIFFLFVNENFLFSDDRFYKDERKFTEEETNDALNFSSEKIKVYVKKIDYELSEDEKIKIFDPNSYNLTIQNTDNKYTRLYLYSEYGYKIFYVEKSKNEDFLQRMKIFHDGNFSEEEVMAHRNFSLYFYRLKIFKIDFSIDISEEFSEKINDINTTINSVNSVNSFNFKKIDNILDIFEIDNSWKKRRWEGYEKIKKPMLEKKKIFLKNLNYINNEINIQNEKYKYSLLNPFKKIKYDDLKRRIKEEIEDGYYCLYERTLQEKEDFCFENGF